MIISICLSVIFIYIHKFRDFFEEIIACHALKDVFLLKKRLLYFFLGFWPRESYLLLRLFPERVTHLKFIQVPFLPIIFDELKESALKIQQKKRQLESFQKFSRSNASCTQSSMLITEIAMTIFFSRFLKNVLLNFTPSILFLM